MLFTAESHEEVFLSVKHLLAVQSGALQRLAELAEEVSHIAKAERFNREKFGDDTAYADWVQSRCRFVLSARAPSAKEGKS
jgi:hypothetical protein